MGLVDDLNAKNKLLVPPVEAAPVRTSPDTLAICAAIDRLGDKLAHATVWAAIHAHGRGTSQVMADADIVADAYIAAMRAKGEQGGK